MLEMLEIVQKIILLLGLFYFAWQDYKTKTIALVPVFLVAIIGVFLQLGIGEMWAWKILTSTLVGAVILLISFLTEESVGIGDGLLFLVSGMYLDFSQNVTLLCGTLFLTGGFAAICLGLKKMKKKDRIPMAPFMLAAYVMFIL